MVREVERRVGAEYASKLRVLGPTRDKRGSVAAKPADLVLTGRWCDHDAAVRGLSVELDPLGQRPSRRRVLARAGNASLLECEREAVGREREHHLLGLAEGVAEQHRGDPAVQGAAA